MSERKSRYELFLEEEAREAQPTKQCPRCKEVKILSSYHKNKNRKFGVDLYCKQCRAAPRRYKDKTDRFWKAYHSSLKIGGCLEWTGVYSGSKRDKNGSPRWGRESVRRKVYRLSIGEIPNNMVVKTTCNNRRCVRQSHMYLITKDEFKGILSNRASHGESHYKTTLTDADLYQIKELHFHQGISKRSIAKQYNVAHSTIIRIFQGLRRGGIPNADES